VGHGPLSLSNSLQDKDCTNWTASQPETYPKEDTSALLAEFLASCKAQGRSQQALIGLRNRVPRLFAYLDESSLDLLTLKVKDTQGYIGWLSARRAARSGMPLSTRTVASYFEAASYFYEYLKHRGLVSSNPFKETRRVRTEKKIPRGLLKETEMEVLLAELERFDEMTHLKAAITRYKVHVAAELMYATGLRVSEVAGLRLVDIDFSRSMIRVHEAKGGYERFAFMGEFAREVLRLYVERLRILASSEWNHRNEALLFGTSWSTFGRILNRELAKACASHGLSPMRSHGFRHALGYHLLRAGCNIRHIQSILGHRQLRNTEIYTKVENEDLRHVVDACHPRRWNGTELERT
jgi:integrase/recombinase XerC